MQELAFLPLPEFSNFGLAAAIEPLFVANWLAHAPLFSWKVVSADGNPVRASNGVVTQVDGGLSEAETCQTVFVLASFDPAAARPPSVLGWLRRICRFGVEIGGIENGALTLAAAGLLDGHTAAVHWDNLPGFQELFPAVRAVPELYSFSAGRITCAGATAILDMMIAWISRHADPGLAHEVAEHLLIGRLRLPETGQKLAGDARPQESDPLVAQAQAIMQERIDEPLTCGEIARRIGLSLRQTERRFRRELGVSVARHYMLLRMARAHQLLQQTGLSVTDVAVACGFQSTEYFSRLYRQAFGCTPSTDRRQSTAAPVLRLRNHAPGDAKILQPGFRRIDVV